MKSISISISLSLFSLLTMPLLAACAASAPSVAVDTSTLPAEVRVPAGNKPSLALKAVGTMIWKCDYKGPFTDQKYEWQLDQPDLKLLDNQGKQVGRLFGSPAQFDHWAASNITVTPVAEAPAGSDNLPLALVKANPATGSPGPLTGTTYVQRVATKGGIAPTADCNWMNVRQTRQAPFEAEYVFYRAM